jgi:hypothetical protein
VYEFFKVQRFLANVKESYLTFQSRKSGHFTSRFNGLFIPRLTTPAEMHEFFDRAIKLDLPAVSWWEWGAALRYSLENEFVTMQWPGVVTPPPQPKTIEERLADLEADMITVKARLNL